MEWWRQIGNWLYRRALSRAVSARAVRRAVGWEQVERIGILVDSDEPGLLRAARKWAAAMEGAGKRVRVLHCTARKPTRGKEPEADTLYCTEVNWYGKPSGAIAERFSSHELDLLVVFAKSLSRPMHWLTSVSKAACRIGMDTCATDCLDLIVEMPEGRYEDFPAEVEKLMRLNATSDRWVS